MNDSAEQTARAVTFAPDDRSFVYAVARRIVGSAEDAEDCTQDALLLAFRHRESFRGESQYRTWLYRITATTALGHLRQQRRLRRHLRADDCEHALANRVDPAQSPSERLAAAEDRARVHEALDRLAPLYREVVIARADAGEQEVADQLGISVANVKIRAHRARLQMREWLARMDP